MRVDLRKGQSSIYIQYKTGGDAIGVKNTEVEVINNIAIIRFELNPVDQNQRIDAQNLDKDEPMEIHISDDYIIENLYQFLNQSYVNAQELRVEIIYKTKIYNYPIAFGAAGLNFLPLLVGENAS